MLTATNYLCDWDQLIEKLLLSHFQYGRYPLFPALSTITDNIETVWEVYSKYPQTCINLLKQVATPCSKEEYEQKVLAVIKDRCKVEPALEYLASSLSILRKFMGDDPNFINSTFRHEIAMLNGENKNDEYLKIVDKTCRQAIKETIDNIQNSYQKNERINNKALI